MSAPIPENVKAHPDYADGYYAAVAGEPFDTDRAASEQYAYGYEAGDRAVKLLKAHGFRRRGSTFSITVGAGR